MQRLKDGDFLKDEEEESKPMTYVAEQSKLKEDLKSAFASLDTVKEEEEGDDFLKVRSKSREELKKEEEDYRSFILKNLGNDGELFALEKMQERATDDKEKFLMDYILNKGWVDQSSSRIPSYDEIVQLSDEDSHDEEAEEFERAHNFRFEEGGSASVITHARDVANSMRRKDDKRKQDRERYNERKELERKQKEEDLKRLKNLKKAEIIERLKKIQDIAGIKSTKKGNEDELNIIGLDTVALGRVLEDEEFDPEKYDETMQQVFNDEYYGMDDPDKKPVFDDDIDIDDIIGKNHNEEDFVMDADFLPGGEKYSEEKDGKDKKKKKSMFGVFAYSYLLL